MNTLVINVEGMMCNHCKAHVEQACKKVANVVDAVASLDEKNVKVTFNGNVDRNEIVESIKEAGYEAK